MFDHGFKQNDVERVLLQIGSFQRSVDKIESCAFQIVQSVAGWVQSDAVIKPTRQEEHVPLAASSIEEATGRHYLSYPAEQSFVGAADHREPHSFPNRFEPPPATEFPPLPGPPIAFLWQLLARRHWVQKYAPACASPNRDGNGRRVPEISCLPAMQF